MCRENYTGTGVTGRGARGRQFPQTSSKVFITFKIDWGPVPFDPLLPIGRHAYGQAWLTPPKYRAYEFYNLKFFLNLANLKCNIFVSDVNLTMTRI